MDINQLYTGKLYQFVQDHLQEDPALLLLKYHQSADFNVKEAVQQIAARQKAKEKLPTWTAHPKVIFPYWLSLEQSSSEKTALFKAGFLHGHKLVDLTGGFGVDTLILGKNFQEVAYFEKQEKLAEIVAHNINCLSKNPKKYTIYSSDSLRFLESTDQVCDWLYVDPARRGSGNLKLFKLADCEPDVKANWGLMKKKSHNILIKASPMLDIKSVLGELPDIKQIMVVAVKNEVKEVLLIWGEKGRESEVKISAIDLLDNTVQKFEFTLEEEKNTHISYAYPQEFLIEPSSAIMKLGAFKSFAERFGLMKLHPNTHLYTDSRITGKIPGRIFKIIKEIKLDKKELRDLLPSGKANVMVRNHPMKAEAIKKKYRIKDGGDHFLIATRTMEGKARAYWCERQN